MADCNKRKGDWMNFIDLHRQYERIANDLEDRLEKIFHHKHFIMGPEVQELETALGSYTERKFCLSCSNGTDALVIALMALGVGPGDAVFVPSFTFFATAESVSLVGATPIFVDSGASFNMDPDSLASIIRETTSKGDLIAKAIIPVDLFGLIADYPKIQQIADEYGLFVISDAAQSFGSKWLGKPACSFGDIATTSFFPAKPFGCYGDGGAIFTDNEELFNLMSSIRVHGQGTSKYINERIGMNGRLDTIQAAVLLSKLEIFEDELNRKQRIAFEYSSRLGESFECPIIPDNSYSSFAQFTILAQCEEQRDRITRDLPHKGIPIMIYYPTPLHLQNAYKYLGGKEGDHPTSESFSRRVFSVPMHPYLSLEEIEMVCGLLIDLAQ